MYCLELYLIIYVRSMNKNEEVYEGIISLVSTHCFLFQRYEEKNLIMPYLLVCLIDLLVVNVVAFHPF